jgi:CO/xanthine dehydrogenase FAD-binding subunit
VPAEPPIDVAHSLAEAYGALAGGGVTPIAGGTDIMVRITGELGPPPERMVDLSRLEELTGIDLEGGSLVLGARTTFTDIRRSALCREHLPALVEAAATVGAVQIQNRGTLGGNLANASPAGDSLPVLLAADAVIVAGSARGEREIDCRDFFTGYRRTALSPDELILRVRIPLPAGREVRFRKVGTRRAQAISKVVLALAWRDHGGAAGWSDVRVALGSVAATPIRAAAAEAALEGARPVPEVVDRVAEILATEISPIDDVRSTADYRRTVAARVLHRLLRDAGGW